MSNLLYFFDDLWQSNLALCLGENNRSGQKERCCSRGCLALPGGLDPEPGPAV